MNDLWLFNRVLNRHFSQARSDIGAKLSEGMATKMG